MVKEPCKEEGYHRSRWHEIKQIIHKLISYNDLYYFTKKKVPRTLSDRKYKKNVVTFTYLMTKKIKKMATGCQPPLYSCLLQLLLSLRSLLCRSLGRSLFNLRSVRLLGAASTC